jgi:hypothetical protein
MGRPEPKLTLLHLVDASLQLPVLLVKQLHPAAHHSRLGKRPWVFLGIAEADTLWFYSKPP